METKHFDDLIKRVETTRLTRGGAVRGIIAGAVAALAGAALSAEETDAKRRRRRRRRSKVSAASNAHFISARAALSGANLDVSFKEAGLGNNQNIDYVAAADATATYVCVNRGGANPSATNKTTVSGPVSASGTFNSGKNGQVTASLTILPPSAGSFSCPPGQSRELAQVSYTNVTITDTTNNVSEDIPGTFDTGCLLPDVRGACS